MLRAWSCAAFLRLLCLVLSSREASKPPWSKFQLRVSEKQPLHRPPHGKHHSAASAKQGARSQTSPGNTNTIQSSAQKKSDINLLRYALFFCLENSRKSGFWHPSHTLPFAFKPFNNASGMVRRKPQHTNRLAIHFIRRKYRIGLATFSFGFWYLAESSLDRITSTLGQD